MADHGRLFDNFSASPSHTHGGSYFDAGFGLQTLQDAHGKLYDLFGVPRDSSAHGERYDEFGWRAMPAVHGQQFDSDFRQPTSHDGSDGHATWFDAFRGGTEVRYMLEGADYEGVVIQCNSDHAVVRARDGQTHEVGLSQFLAYRTPNEEQAAPATPASDAEAPSAHSADAHGAFHGDRNPVPTDMPPVIQEAPQGQYTEPRSGVPEGIMDTFTRVKSLVDRYEADDVAKAFPKVGESYHSPAACPSCGSHSFTLGARNTSLPKHPSRPGGFVGSSHVTCTNCKGVHALGSHPPVRVGKSVDSTETAVQGGSAAKTVGHRNNCPRGGSAPCGAEVDGRCSICRAEVHDHDAVGKASTGDLGIEVPEREHKSTDHHSSQEKPGRCPHCGQVLAEVNHQTEQGQPDRAHKCMGSTLDLLKSLAEA